MRAAKSGARFGSSPRARGTRKHSVRPCLFLRFIPACAGNTVCAESSFAPISVHPRVRGEHLGNTPKALAMYGSSPRARGTLLTGIPGAGKTRFIPACAGNTLGYVSTVAEVAVHPRVRGEHRIDPLWIFPVPGSSPRARGTLCVCGFCGFDSRFIPACAGNTQAATRTRRAIAVHPRVRGEHSTRIPQIAVYIGSSPRARGTPATRASQDSVQRFIPACAGNTPQESICHASITVHPRVRGEHA